ncbi:hypothetical protein D3C72_2427090 [compost metagenome]
MIVDAYHDLTPAPAHEVGHAFIVFKRKINTIAGSLPVRRIHVVESVGTVVALGAIKPG